MTDQTSRSRSWSWVVLLTVVSGASYVVYRNAEAIRDTYAEIGWSALVVAGLFGLGGTLTIGMVWRSLLLGMESSHTSADVRLFDLLGTFYATQLGKYVPGAVWPILAQVAAARRWGVRASSVVATNLLMMYLLAATGVVLGLVLLPWSTEFGRPWLAWGLVLVPLLVWSLWPGVAANVLRRLPTPERWRFDVPVSPRASWVGLAWTQATWLLLGTQLWVLLRAAGGDGPESFAAAVGGAGLAYAVGLVVVVAPAGAGAREAVLVAVCAPLVGGPQALAIALACRLLLTLADVLLAVTGGLWRAVSGAQGSVPTRVEE